MLPWLRFLLLEHKQKPCSISKKFTTNLFQFQFSNKTHDIEMKSIIIVVDFSLSVFFYIKNNVNIIIILTLCLPKTSLSRLENLTFFMDLDTEVGMLLCSCFFV